MQEARGSYNGYFRGPGGSKDQFTLRQSDEQSDAEFIARVGQFTAQLAEQGWTPWGAGESAEGVENREGSGEIKTFEVESITLAAGGEHPRWVVKGGNFTKFGVTCWPETLEAAGIAAKLDPLKENKPSGNWVARYAERLNDEGRWVPDKVTELVKSS